MTYPVAAGGEADKPHSVSPHLPRRRPPSTLWASTQPGQAPLSQHATHKVTANQTPEEPCPEAALNTDTHTHPDACAHTHIDISHTHTPTDTLMFTHTHVHTDTDLSHTHMPTQPHTCSQTRPTPTPTQTHVFTSRHTPSHPHTDTHTRLTALLQGEEAAVASMSALNTTFEAPQALRK